MIEGIAASVKRGGNRVEPGSVRNIEERRVEVVILNSKMVYHIGEVVVKYCLYDLKPEFPFKTHIYPHPFLTQVTILLSPH